MHDRVRLRAADRAEDCVAVGDVEHVVPCGDYVVTGEAGDDVATELPAGARDENAHDGQEAGEALRGSHHQRLSLYHATVSASASSSSRSGFQPSARTFDVSME